MSQVCSVRSARTQRRMEKATYSRDVKGNYHFYGTSKNDKIHVYRKNGKVQVRINNREMTLSMEEAKKMTIHAGGGDDQVLLGDGLPRGIKVHGGSGNDRMINNSNGVKINGGRGNDKIFNLGNRCHIKGGSGNDGVVSYGRRNTIDGGRGRDRVKANRGTRVRRAWDMNRADGTRGRRGPQRRSANSFFANVFKSLFKKLVG